MAKRKELPDQIELLSWRQVAPVMASRLDGLGRGLNLLSGERSPWRPSCKLRSSMAAGNENHLLRAALRHVSPA
jgi:hypothetical protein